MFVIEVAAAAKKQPLRVERTNKSELRNCLTYRVLIYIFEVRMKTFFFSNEKFRGRNPNLKRLENKKTASFYFF